MKLNGERLAIEQQWLHEMDGFDKRKGGQRSARVRGNNGMGRGNGGVGKAQLKTTDVSERTQREGGKEGKETKGREPEVEVGAGQVGVMECKMGARETIVLTDKNKTSQRCTDGGDRGVRSGGRCG